MTGVDATADAVDSFADPQPLIVPGLHRVLEVCEQRRARPTLTSGSRAAPH